MILLSGIQAFGQTDSIKVSLEQSLKQSLLKSIQVKTDSMDDQLGTKLTDLDERIQMLDKSLSQTSSEAQIGRAHV